MHSTRQFQSLSPLSPGSKRCVPYRETSLWDTLRMCIWQKGTVIHTCAACTETLIKEALGTATFPSPKPQLACKSGKVGGTVLESDSIMLNFFSRSSIQNSPSLSRSSQKLTNARPLLDSTLQDEILHLWPVSLMVRVPVFPWGQMTSSTTRYFLLPPLTAL